MLESLPVRTDVLVLVVAVLLYLIDLSRLLHANELLFVGRGVSRWSALTPQSGFLFNRRYAVFPRAFDPGAIIVKLLWPVAPPRPADARQSLQADIRSAVRRLQFARIVCTLLLPQIFVGIPAAWWLADSRLALLVLLLAIYLQIVALVVWLLLSARTLGLSWKTVLLLTFEALVCIPYAINLHRKVAEKVIARPHLDVLDTGAALLPAVGQARLKAFLKSAIDRQVRPGDDSIALTAALQALRRRLDEGASNEPC